MRNWTAAALAAVGVLVLAGCGSKTDSSTSASGGSKPSGDPVEVVIFQGGYGIDFFEQAAKEYEEKHPGVKLHVTGNPRVWEQLRPQFVAGKPPALTWPGWGFDYWPAAYEGQIMPMDDALKGKPYEGTGTWGDTFEPALLKQGQHDGKTFLLPYHFNMNGWWFNPDVFSKNGWAVPKTYQELLDLCPKIKAAGIAPITYQGKYPYYMIEGFLFPWAVSIGGIQVLDDAQMIKPGAWKSPAFLQAATMIKDLKDRGFFEEGANAINHTEAQMDFLNGKAAMIPCGTWLWTEMKKVMPPGAKMQFMLPPVVAGGKGDASAIEVGVEPFIIPTEGKDHEIAIDFYKYLTSVPKAKQFVQEKGTLMAIKGSGEGELPEHLKPAAEAFKNSKTVWYAEYRHWYPKLGTESENAFTALLNGENSPQQFCDRCEAAAEIARNDKKLQKHEIVR